MKVLDRYILREFLRNFLFSLLFFTILLLVVRFSEKEMGGFISRNMSILSSMFSLGLQTPGFVIQVAPPSVLFAVFFSLGRMAQNNEITAMKSAGISLYRVFQPVLIAAFLIALFMIIFNDQVATRANGKDAELKDSGSRRSDIATNVVFVGSGGRVFHINLIMFNNHAMQNVTIHEFGEDNNVQREIFASQASWDQILFNMELDLQEDLENGTLSGRIREQFTENMAPLPQNATILAKEEQDTWMIRDAGGTTMYVIKKEDNSLNTYENQKWHLTRGVVRTFEGDSWEEEPYARMELTVPEDPEFMAKSMRDLKEMSFSEMRELIKHKKLAGQPVRKDRVSLHDKISFPFACFIMALLGAPLFVIFGRSGMAVGFLLTMFTSFLYWGVAIAVFEAFGNNGKLPPMLSCWAANFIFAAVGIGLVYKVKK